MDIDCPDCGRRVTLEANNIVPYHDNAPPLRSVCRASKEDATPVVEIMNRARTTLSTDELAALAEARGLRLVAAEHVLDIEAARAEGAAAEREACAKEADRFAAIASSNDPDEDDYQRGAMNCAQSLAGRIRARSNGGAQ